jgi:hypothetical protein
MAGAVRSCDVRSVTFNGFESVVSRDAVLERILFVC